MANSLKLQFSSVPTTTKPFPRTHTRFGPSPRFTFVTVRSNLNLETMTTTAPILSEPSIFSGYKESVGSPLTPPALSFTQWNLTHRHIFVLNAIASVVAVSVTWLFVSAIPAILAFRRAAESLEKLMDATREELPDTMAAVRLSGMEISDLTMELSDVGQEITQGVRSSTRAVRSAEERLRQFTSMAPSASLQRVKYPIKTDAGGGPPLARTARGMKEGIVKGRALLRMFFTLTGLSRIVLGCFSKRVEK